MSIANSNIFLYHTDTRQSPVNIGRNAHRDKITRRASKTFFLRRVDFRRRITHAKRPAKVAAKVAQSRARIDAPRTPTTHPENTRKPPRRFCKLSRINHPCPSPAPALPLLVLDLLNISSRDKRGVDPGAALGDFCGYFCGVFRVCDSAAKIGAATKKKF